MAYYDDSEDQNAVDPNAPPEQPGQQGSSVISGQGAAGGPTNTPAATELFGKRITSLPWM